LLNSIRALEKIQKIDLEIKAVEEEEKVFLRDMDLFSSEANGIRQAMEAISPEIEGLKAQSRDLDEKIQTSIEKVAKDEKRLGEIKNDKELNAVTKEISAANKAKRLAEEEKARLNSRLDELNERLDSKKQALEEREAQYNGLKDGLLKKRAEWKESIERNTDLRNMIKADVRPDIFKKYEMIRSKRSGVAIVEVHNETCTGCHMHIPPQVYLELKKGNLDEIITCPHCHRILFVQAAKETV
jgi:predicted  nucleic acid-binding Zn-ribbon protein